MEDTPNLAPSTEDHVLLELVCPRSKTLSSKIKAVGELNGLQNFTFTPC